MLRSLLKTSSVFASIVSDFANSEFDICAAVTSFRGVLPPEQTVIISEGNEKDNYQPLDLLYRL